MGKMGQRHEDNGTMKEPWKLRSMEYVHNREIFPAVLPICCPWSSLNSRAYRNSIADQNHSAFSKQLDIILSLNNNLKDCILKLVIIIALRWHRRSNTVFGIFV